MSVIYLPVEPQEITKLSCPQCNERVKYVGLLLNSKIDGLTFKCPSCKRLWKVKSE